EARRVADVAEAFYALDSARIQGVLILSSPLFGGNPQMIADLAVRRTVPTISLFPDIAREGGLLAYGPEIEALYRQAAGMARKVLDGARVAELPAERPTRFQSSEPSDSETFRHHAADLDPIARRRGD